MWPRIDDLHRTAKQLVDAGRARSQQEAEEHLARFVLQIDVGDGLENNRALQAALLTAVNAGRRAFLGGVVARLSTDPVLDWGWAAGCRMSDAVTFWGAQVTSQLSPQHPTFVIGHRSLASVGDPVVEAVVRGWSGAVAQPEAQQSAQDALPLAGVAAGALAVSELFQATLGDVVAGRREVGVSLWNPAVDWKRVEDAPDVEYLPSALWLLGLGHLGQGYAWSLGFLPYAAQGQLMTYLVDTDSVVKGNLATGLLSLSGDIGRPKARLVSSRLESLGIGTRIVERRFDKNFWPTDTEPRMALAGFDDPAPRRLLGEGRFDHVVDVGLGAGHTEYLDMLIHTFPSQIDPAAAFDDAPPVQRTLPAAYREEVARRIKSGEAEGDAECGVTMAAGITVGAAFVGALAGALAVSDVLRQLHGGPRLSVLAIDLRSPADYVAASAPTSLSLNVGFVRAAKPTQPSVRMRC